MRAVILAEYGPPSNLKSATLPDPTPGANEIVVRMAGASLNPIDWKQRSGALKQFIPLKLPAVLGRDASGTVAAVGAAVRGLEVGDRVLGLSTGCYAELVVGPRDSWAVVPEQLDLVDAGALPLVLVTGAQLAEDATGVQAGETILVTGATGSVGRVALFAAKARGATVFAGVRAKHRDVAQRLGADGVVALDDDGEIAKLPTLDGIADTVGEQPPSSTPSSKPAGRSAAWWASPRARSSAASWCAPSCPTPIPSGWANWRRPQPTASWWFRS